MNHVQKKVEEIRTGLGVRGRVDIEKVANELGFYVDNWLFPGTHVNGVVIGNSIGVRADLPSRERRWTIAHELGHAMLHQSGCNQVWLYSTNQQAYKEEQEAEAFAFLLLVDRVRFFHLSAGERSEVASVYGVPIGKLKPPFGGFLV